MTTYNENIEMDIPVYKPNINIIVAFTKKFGIGINSSLPWNLPEDLKHFSTITKGNVVVMGKHTWNSIPNDKKPLKNRINVVVTTTPDKIVPISNEVYVHPDNLDDYLSIFKNVFVIGGAMLYKKYMGVASKIYATVIEKDFECDTYFPVDDFHHYEIEEYSELKEFNEIKYRFITYTRTDQKHGEFVYLDLMKEILDKGNNRMDRTLVGTKSLFGKQVRFDISKSIPLFTTKFVGYKSIINELLFFLKGQTDSKILEQQGVNIWKDNTSRDFLDKRGLQHYEVGSLGKMYGWLWRFWGQKYTGCNVKYNPDDGFDQLKWLINNLKTNPYDRRHLLTAYDPAAVKDSVLAPCHGQCQFYVEDIDDKKYLSCHMYQRSNDVFLGGPYNVTSYSVFTYILAKLCNYLPKELVISYGDAHLYNSHHQQSVLQLSRSPLPFPRLIVSDSILSKEIEDITIDDFTIIGYLHHASIKAPMAV